ncbi:HEL048Wp [Eremothecium sinecaudum]|uniref:Alpha-1,3-glucosyltransferase n=1 Tax=Eremothecium sinecaudum TaxID=45286 RepID=A0A0X8HTH5_9SACH|nr:HEL048Wp [Eremothecium sinecaudum]AMD21232.1 HEL048Wp [Eremothecium sinecaudum]
MSPSKVGRKPGSKGKPDFSSSKGSISQQTEPKQQLRFSLWNFWVASTALKVLLMPDYVSTDFDVHRNWMAITNKLPLKEWYLESTSQWTLDYPPFFAYFEWFLSQVVPASVRADGCLDIVEVGQYGWPTILFQRSTVIISEILLFVVLQIFINTSDVSERSVNFVVASSIALSPAFFIIDHIHFQYNGFLFAILIGSIIAAKKQRYLLCGALFATSLCFKHIFLYLAPAYFVFLLRAYVLDINALKYKSYRDWVFVPQWRNLFKLGGVVLLIFTICFAPFITVMPQLIARLFPFSRGLTHAYWAPNFWAIYSFVDKVLAAVMLRMPYVHNCVSKLFRPLLVPATREEIKHKMATVNNGTRGLVQDVYFLILPQIQPKLTFLLTLFYQLLAVIPVFINPSFKRFIGSLTLCGFSAFLFGWHVHEKAIMLVIIPFFFLVSFDRRFLTPFYLLTASGYVSLFPLLYKSNDFLIKVLYTLIWCIIYFSAFRKLVRVSSSVQRRIFFFDRLAALYCLLLLPMVLGIQSLEVLKGRYSPIRKYEFLGLMFYSIYCSIGVIGSWIGLSWLYNFDEPLWV